MGGNGVSRGDESKRNLRENTTDIEVHVVSCNWGGRSSSVSEVSYAASPHTKKSIHF